MMSKVGAGKKDGEDSGNGKLLREIETISKALYLDKNPSRSSIPGSGGQSRSAARTQLLDPRREPKSGKEDPLGKDKKSIWNWKPLKAFYRSRKFNCCFSLQVHSIEGLPSSLANASFRVHWKRRDGELVTRPVKVLDGVAEFEEKLTLTCAVYGSRSGPHHSAKYEAKHFLLFASILGAPEVDLGKHRVDLTRLLPLTLEELEEEKSSGKWTTSYRLSGQAKGSMLNVSFGYTVVGESPAPVGNSRNVNDAMILKQNSARTVKVVPKLGQDDGKNTMHRAVGLPDTLRRPPSVSPQSVEDVKDLHEVLPVLKSEHAFPADVASQKTNEVKFNASVDEKPDPLLVPENVEPVKPHCFPVSESCQNSVDNQCEDSEFSVAEQGIELSSEEKQKLDDIVTEAADVSIVKDKTDGDFQGNFEDGIKIQPNDVGSDSHKDELVHGCDFKQEEICSKESVMKELEHALNNVSNLEAEAYDSPEEKETVASIPTEYEANWVGSSLGLDDVTESVANEFLDLLGIENSPLGLSSESEPESPRERLLRQFEKDALAGGYSLFDFDVSYEDQGEYGYNTSNSGWGKLTEDFDLSSVVQAAEEEHQRGTQAGSGKAKAKMLADLETEALMREWGLNDRAFQCSPPKSSGGFGSPIDLPPEELPELPPLGEGLGPFMQTKNGGFVRSMNPSLFKNAKTGGSLIMQVSSPVVVPAEMGSGVMDILQQLASVGIEKLSMQANKVMPLEDITGKTMQQVAWEAGASLEGPDSQILLQHESEAVQDAHGGQKINKEMPSAARSNKFSSSSSSRCSETGTEYVSLEDLAPLAMDKIEALSVEGLRIQSGMSDEEAPSNISTQSIGEISALQGKDANISGSLGLEGTAGLQLLNIKDSGEDNDGLMDLSLTLDEWMRLDSGDIGDEDEISERTSKLLAAHHASSLDLIRGGAKGERKRGKGSGRKCGLLGNNFTVALMVQLHDPLRNFEPVGTPMLALIQVERVFVPPKPKIYCKVSEVRSNDEEDDESKSVVKEEPKEESGREKASEEEPIPQFKISEVHVAGLKTEPGKKKLWGSSNQQQSGSRWLLANGMGKSNKHPLMKSKAVPTKSATPQTMKVQPGDTLWSISSRVYGTGAKWKELAALNPHIRNPNVILPSQTIRLQ